MCCSNRCYIQSQICKEFVLPLAEAGTDHFTTGLVCFYPPPPSVHITPFPRHIGLVAVSPTGVAFSWNNVLQHDKAKGCVEKIVVEGGGAHSLQCIPVSMLVPYSTCVINYVICIGDRLPVGN